ncbi:MAG: Rne/Rng family ribonuclease [Candidatus Sericytochromatia bacterium]
MSREIVVSEAEKIAVVLENGIVREFYLSEGEQYVGDIILATVESIVPAIEAAFLDIGREKSGFIHVSDLPASKKQQSGIRQFLKPQQQLLVQVTREPTGNKGACLSGFIQLPGRFLVLTPFERRIGLSKRIYDARERARLARIARMICGSGYGIVLRPEAVGQSEQTLREDLKLLLGRWKHILGSSEKGASGTTLYRDQDILERILREGATASVTRIVVDSQATYDRAMKYFNNWSDTKARAKLRVYSGTAPILSNYGIYQQMEKAIQPLVQLPSGGTLVIQATEALTTIDVNTSSMTSTDNQPETILRTNIEAAEETARQLVLRDIGGLIVIDFIDMDNPRDQQVVWQKLSDALQHDKSQPQISYFSEFGLVEMSRRRQRQRLSEMLTMSCPTCQGVGRIRNLLYRSDMLTGEGMKVRIPLLQAEEKTSRYRGGVEKAAVVAPPVQVAAASTGGRQQQRGGVSKGRQVAPAPAPMPMAEPINEPMLYDEPEIETKAKPAPVSRTPAEEKPEDLLFDDSIFTNEITDEVLENYIEREDNLNVSGRLAGSLDELLARIETEGLASIKRVARSDGEEDEGEEEPSLIDEYIAEEGDEELPADMVEDSDEPAVEEEAPARSRRGGRGRRRPEPFARALDPIDEAVDEDEEPVDEPDLAVMDQVDDRIDFEEAEEDEAEFEADEDEGVTISPASLAESALTAKASALNKAKPAKRILTKRRTIRSFRPKR